MGKLSSRLLGRARLKVKSLSQAASTKKAAATKTRHRTTLVDLPEELLVRIVSFCDLSDVFRLRRSCKNLSHVLDRSSAAEDILCQLMDNPRPTNGVPDRDVLVEMVKLQLDAESKNQDVRRDTFLCLAISLPSQQRTRVKEALRPFLARAQITGSGRDPGEDHGLDAGPLASLLGNLTLDDHVIAIELEKRIGIVSTLLVLGCWDVCDLDMGHQLMDINHWSNKSNIWTERKLLQSKDVSLQLALTMVMGLLNPTANWPPLEQSAASAEYKSLAQRVRADYHGAGFKTPASQAFWLSWEGIHTRSLQLAGLIAYQLKISGFEDVPRADLLPLLVARSNSSSSQALQPTRLRIPLLENFSRDGIRAQPASWQAWYTSRVRDMIEHIEDEEWYGYYVYTLDNNSSTNVSILFRGNMLRSSSKDPAMEHVFFKLGHGGGGNSGKKNSNSSSATTTTTTAASQKLPLEARGGRDGVTAEFDFVGSMDCDTGILSLSKNYRGAHSWDYDGVMTPLGIVGEWGREGLGWDGYFWLWPRSWMVKNAVRKTFAYL